MPGGSLPAQCHDCERPTKEHIMHELNDLNPDVMRAELAYRRERLAAERRLTASGVARRIRRRRASSAPIA
jgi:hypothetical protein